MSKQMTAHTQSSLKHTFLIPIEARILEYTSFWASRWNGSSSSAPIVAIAQTLAAATGLNDSLPFVTSRPYPHQNNDHN